MSERNFKRNNAEGILASYNFDTNKRHFCVDFRLLL